MTHSLIVVPDITIKDLITAIVSAAHSLHDELGEAHPLSTMPEPQLRQAALVALQIAIGESIWPGDRPIRIRRAPRAFGIFRED